MTEGANKVCKGCNKEFWAIRDSKLYCSTSCYTRTWRREHPKIFYCNKPNKIVKKVCGPDGMNRSKAWAWKKYMDENPIYHEMIGRPTIHMMKGLL